MKAKTLISKSEEGVDLLRWKRCEWAWPLWEMPEREARCWLERNTRVKFDSLPAAVQNAAILAADAAVDYAILKFRVEEIFCPLFPEVWSGVDSVLTDSQCEVMIALGLYSGAADVAASLGFSNVEEFAAEVEYYLRRSCLRASRAALRLWVNAGGLGDFAAS